MNIGTRSIGWELVVGDGGTGNLLVTGGLVDADDTMIGSSHGSSGSITVTGGTLNGGLFFRVGGFGNGNLLVNGGLVSSTLGYLAYFTGGTGNATVTCGTWPISNRLEVGDDGTGNLLVNGGVVTASSLVVGDGDESRGNVTVTSGTLAVVNGLLVGNAGSGTMSLTGGLVSAGSVALNTVCTLNIGTRTTVGILQTSNVSGAGLVNFNHTGSHSFAPNLSGALAVSKLGSGTTTLTGSNSYTRGTTVNAGTLLRGVSKSILPLGNSDALGKPKLRTGPGRRPVFAPGRNS